MCGRFYLYSLPEDVARALGARLPDDLAWQAPRYNIAPTQEIIIVRPQRDRGALELRTARWGLVPHWAESMSAGASGGPLINARSESAASKPAFRDAFARRRCLIPANGFYEWQAPAGGPGAPAPRRPMRAQRPDGGLLTMAGVWETWRDPQDPSIRLRSCAILTTNANERLAGIHDRMPVFLEGADRQAWLDPGASAEALQALLRPAPDDLLEPAPISRRVNRVENDDPSLLAPAEGDEQPGLFG